jgi:hypothetical protein
MLTLWQGGSQRHDGVASTHKGDLERFGLINLCHEVATLWLGHHLQRRSCEAGIDLHAREREARTLRLVEADTPDVLYVFVGRTDDGALNGQCRGSSTNHGSKGHAKCQERTFHMKVFVVLPAKIRKKRQLAIDN